MSKSRKMRRHALEQRQAQIANVAQQKAQSMYDSEQKPSIPQVEYGDSVTMPAMRVPETVISPSLKPVNVVKSTNGTDLSLDWQMIPTDKIRIPEEYQRKIDYKRVREMVRNFDIKLFTPLDVCLRDDGFYYVADGQHHFMAGCVKNAPFMPCIVHKGMSIEEEATFFKEKNCNQRRPSPNAIFKAAGVSRDPKYSELNRIFATYGIKIGNRVCANTITAIGDVMKLIDEYSQEIVCDAFAHSVTLWPEHKNNCGTDIIGGLCELFKLNIDDIQLARLYERLQGSDLSKAFKELQGKLMQLNIETKRSTQIKRDLMYSQLITLFNKGLRRNADKLPLRGI